MKSTQDDRPVEEAAAAETIPADVVESSVTDLVERKDRYPPNLFLISAPGFVLFPDLTSPIIVQEAWAERTLQQAQSQSEWIGVIAQTDAVPSDATPPAPGEVTVGCLARVLRTLQMPNGSKTVLLQGVRRFQVERWLRTDPYFIAKVRYPDEIPATDEESEALLRNLRELLRQLIEGNSAVSEEMGIAVLNIERKGALADFATAYFVKDAAVRNEMLGQFDVKRRLYRVDEELTSELQLLDLGNRIQDEIREKIESRQREFFLREQLKAIRRELGEESDERSLDLAAFRKQMAERTLPENIRSRLEEELRRLEVLSQESPESGLLRSYVEWLLALAWDVETQDTTDLSIARQTLDADHAGLEEIKERILEFLAVRARVPDHKGQILCFSGPPGVGKTSLGQSIARALGREFVRISLGGVHDEAEIRGHRRTYIGSLPGRIVRGLKSAGSMNPVFVLDELDKVGQDFRGDPSSALLEVLDPEQNHQFSDHYLEVPIDLSRVFFIATANDIDAIPGPLRDRLEVIEMSGYMTEEKLEIARDFLVPRQRERHGLMKKELGLRKATLQRIIEDYTREAGVRGLEKNLARICRKAVTRLSGGKVQRVSVASSELPEFLGPPRFQRSGRRALQPGIAVGLAWTPVGGEVLEVQVVSVPRAAKPLELTGMLGDVMLESARIALSYVEGRAEELGITSDLADGTGLHLHLPQGAVRKDGPSAGITMATAYLSLRRGRPMRSSLAMTGELTLTGQVLAVGGIRDKILAARRQGIREIVLPADNRKDLEEIPRDLVKGMRFHFVEDYSEVASLVFSRPRKPKGAARSRK